MAAGKPRAACAGNQSIAMQAIRTEITLIKAGNEQRATLSLRAVVADHQAACEVADARRTWRSGIRKPLPITSGQLRFYSPDVQSVGAKMLNKLQTMTAAMADYLRRLRIAAAAEARQ